MMDILVVDFFEIEAGPQYRDIRRGEYLPKKINFLFSLRAILVALNALYARKMRIPPE